MDIPMSGPDIGAGERQAVMAVLQTSTLSIGPQLEAFERELAAYLGARHAAGVHSGTSGLHLAVIAAGVQAGDLVVTTPFSFVASANCVLYERAVPVFVDVDPATGNIDPGLVREAVRDLVQGGAAAARWLPRALKRSSVGAWERLRGDGAGRKDYHVRAILPVHAFGQPADMDPILDVARAHGVAVIEDACEAIGAEYEGRKAGTLGDVGVFAFYPNKQMTTGEGGVVVSDHEEWDNLFRSLRNQGRDVFDAWLNHTRLGYNYRLDEMRAALGLTQLRRIEELLAKRAQVAGWYNARLQGLAGVQVPSIAPSTTRMSWFVYVVRLGPAIDRRALMAGLRSQGIPSRPYFSPIHLQPFYAERFGYRRGDYPVTEALGDTSLALPFSSVMSESQVDWVCRHLTRLLGSVRLASSRPALEESASGPR